MTDPAARPTLIQRHWRLFKLVLVSFGAALVLLFVLIVTCQSKLIYFPRPYASGEIAAWARDTGGKTIDFTTRQGNQRAFLQGNLQAPRHLWIVCAGNGSLALDWSDWLVEHAPKEDAWLLVDYPGYGACQGSPSPAHIRENLTTSVPLACREIGWSLPPAPDRLRFFGHSLGAAAALLAASEFKIQRGVLVAPFTSTMDMSRRVTGLPLGLLVRHRFDNLARLAELAARGPGEVVILHGVNDEVIPVAMSRTLQARQPAVVRLHEIPGGRHNTIQEEHADELAQALMDAGQ